MSKFRQGLCVMGCVLATALAHGQSSTRPEENIPSPEMLARAATWTPPKLDVLAARLAAQPDMTGVWAFIQPKGACGGPLFDPVHSVCPPKLPDGAAGFGPLPGTKVTSIPYKPEWQKIYDQHVEEAIQGFSRDTFAACVPYGVPRVVGESPSTFDIIQAPEIMLWYADYSRTERRIFLDGRPHLKSENPRFDGPSYSGHSIGHWEGNTLVVHTVNMIPSFFDETGSPHSDQLEMTERLRLVDKDILENEMTLTDPVAFTRPWVVKRYYRRQTAGTAAQPARRYLDYNDRPCIPNVKIDENGFQVQMLPQEIEAEQAKQGGRPPTE
jgi:hypothetical protein